MTNLYPKNYLENPMWKDGVCTDNPELATAQKNALSEKDYAQYIRLNYTEDRPLALDYLAKNGIHDPDLWDLAYCYDTRNFHTYYKTEPLFKRPFKAEKSVYTLYRGVIPSSQPLESARSWTSNIRIANQFANRDGQSGHIYELQCPADAIIRYISLRNESEYIIDTSKINMADIKIYNTGQ